jgi:hypothetical protein
LKLTGKELSIKGLSGVVTGMAGRFNVRIVEN